MVGAGLPGLGQRVLLLGLGAPGLLLDLGGGEAHLVQEQGDLGAGKLFALGTEEAEMEQADLFVFELEEALQARDFPLQVGQDLGGVGGGS